MWKYKRTELKFRNYFELNEELNKLGADGWDVVYYRENDIENNSNNIVINILIKKHINDTPS
jgi:hypothetical protein